MSKHNIAAIGNANTATKKYIKKKINNKLSNSQKLYDQFLSRDLKH